MFTLYVYTNLSQYQLADHCLQFILLWINYDQKWSGGVTFTFISFLQLSIEQHDAQTQGDVMM